MKKKVRWFDYILVNANWFSLTVRSQTLTPLVLPLLVQQFVGEGLKGTYYGQMRLWTLMVALLSQALFGLLSDRNTSRFGRRRPYLAGGVFFEIIFITLIGFNAGMSGMTGYWVLFILINLSMIGSNASQAATQAFIPDRIPDKNKGIASGIKAIIELPLSLIFVSFVMGKLVEQGELWWVMIALNLVLLAGMFVSLFVREEKLEKAAPLDRKRILGLFVMTGAFTLIILGTGEVVKLILRWTEGLEKSAATPLIGFVGLAGMALATAGGVWAGSRSLLGEETRRNTSFIWWIINRMAFMIGAVNLASFMLYFLQEKYGFVEAEAAIPATFAITIVGLSIMISALPGGMLADKFGRKIVIVAAGILAGIGTAVVVFSPADVDLLRSYLDLGQGIPTGALIEAMGLVYIGAALIGLSLGLFYAANWALGTSLMPEDRVGEFFGMANLAGAGAGAVGAYIGGPIADEFSYTLILLLFGGMMLLSVLALLGIKQTSR